MFSEYLKEYPSLLDSNKDYFNMNECNPDKETGNFVVRKIITQFFYLA